MIQLKILSGKMAGTNFVARHFPVRIGRSAGSDLRLEEPGVWDEHFRIALAGKEGFIFENQPNVSTTINGQALQHAPLRNGDVIEIGALKIQFWLTEAKQKGLNLREAFVWAMVAAITVLQFALIYWLIR